MTSKTATRAWTRNLLMTALVSIVFMAMSTQAFAQELEWRGEWKRFGPWHGAATVALGTGALSTELFWEAPEEPNWTGPALIDDGTRDVLLANRERGLETAAMVSDVLVMSLLAMPVLVDPAVAWAAHDSPDVAGQMALISLESMAVSFLTVNVLKRVIARQRPPFGACYDDPNANETCDDRENLSFPSGHSASAWVGAGLVCVMHEKVELYGSGIENQIPCYAALAGATTVATMRIVSNNHYITDTVVGSLIGFGSGYLLPKLLHFGFGKGRAQVRESTVETGQLMPVLSPSMTGFSFSLRF
jgi:membrane-associated phospholipid phosphatase